jgi:VanZ family protein
MTYRPYWLGLGWMLVGVVCWLSLTPNPVDTGMDQGDKIGHLSAYLVLMTWWGQLDPRRNRLVLGFILMGMALEGLQGLTPHRQPDLLDMLANSAGALLGWLLTRTWPDWLQRLERKWAPSGQ